MHDLHNSKRDMGIRMRDLATDHPIAGNPFFNDLTTRLNQVLADIEEIAADEAASGSAARESTDLREVARDELWEDLKAISRTARAIAQTTPGFDANFKLPSEWNDSDFINTALGFVERATPHTALFVQYGMPNDFLDDLRADTIALQQKMASHSERIADRKSARGRLDEKMEELMIIRRQFDAFYRNVYRDDPGMLSLWTSAKHISRRRGGSGSTPTAPGAPPATPTPGS